MTQPPYICIFVIISLKKDKQNFEAMAISYENLQDPWDSELEYFSAYIVAIRKRN
jgi:hypothetical protein